MAPSDNDSIVYVVDDDLQVRVALKELLESVGLKSQVFGCAAEFMAVKRADEVSCLILDVQLPGISGLDLHAELTRGQENLPTIFMSARADIRMAVKAIKDGAIDFLSKPFRDQDLLDAVYEALRWARANREAHLKMRDLRERYDTLSQREKQVMNLVCSGLMNKQIAAEMGVSEITVKLHRHNLRSKLGISSIPALVRMVRAIESGTGSLHRTLSNEG